MLPALLAPLLFAQALPATPASASNFIVRLSFEEGRRPRAYDDIFNNVTIGVGHNLGAVGRELDRVQFESVTRVNYVDAKAGRAVLIDPQIDSLLTSDLQTTIANVRKLAPNFDDLPREVQEVVIDLGFNLGSGGLKQFRDFRQSIAQRNWRQAAWDLGHKNRQPNSPPSGYSQQVPNRCARNVALLLSLANRK
jgi:GH24 family phage-related lysozyme (muramidase)